MSVVEVKPVVMTDSSEEVVKDNFQEPSPSFCVNKTMTTEGGLKLTFKDTNGSKRVITLTQAPLGLTFDKKLPLEISSVNDEAKRQGVQVGWIILSINDQEIESSGITYAECFELLKMQAAQLPVNEKAVKIIFQTPDGEVTTLFTHKPIGMKIEGFPLTVFSLSPHGEAARKSVKPGWEILSVNDENVTKGPYQNFDEAVKVFQKAVAELPEADLNSVVGA